MSADTPDPARMSSSEPTSGVYASLERAVAVSSRSDGDGEGLWHRLALAVDIAESKPCLGPDIELKRFALRWGNDYAMICNPRDLIHFRLDPSEADLVEMMDGTRTVKEIVVARMGETGDLELSSLGELTLTLAAGNFFDRPYVDVPAALEHALAPRVTPMVRAQQFLKTLSIEWKNADRLAGWIYDHGAKWFFRWWAQLIAIPVAGAGFVAFLYLVHSRRYSFGGQSAAIASLILIALGYVLTFAHELGHATTLTHYGRRIKSAGFMIYFGSPCFFVDSSDGEMLERRQRMLQAFAGPYAEWVLAGIGSLLVVAVPHSSLASVLFKFSVLNYVVVFLNLVPLLELDGYWIFSDVIQVPDLRPRSLAFARHGLWEKLGDRARLSPQELGLTLYATVGIAFSIFAFWTAIYFWRSVFGGLISSLWNGGAVGRLLLLVLALFIAGPVLRAGIDGCRAIAQWGRALWNRLVFRFQRRWRVEAASLVDASALFHNVPEDVLGDLAGLAKLRTLARGEPVFRQGDRPVAFFVVRRGQLEVVEEATNGGADRVLQTLSRGDTFGELGLIEGAPRTATVRASKRSEAFEFGKGAFDAFMADMIDVPTFAPTLQNAAQLQRLPCFAGLRADELAEALRLGSWVNISPGVAVIREGEEADAFYALASGQVEVSKAGRFVRTLGPGAFFGEIALLTHVPRTTTIAAKTPLRVFRLDRQGFDRLIAASFRRGNLRMHAPADRPWQH